MRRVGIKPFSANGCWLGRRISTKPYKDYKEIMQELLPDDVSIPDGKLFIKFRWGLSSAAYDIDNACKPFLDCLQVKYDFNDNKVFKIFMEKVKVKKGEEFIEFDIRSIDDIVVTITDNRKEEILYNE